MTRAQIIREWEKKVEEYNIEDSKPRTKEEILASLQYHLNEAQRLTELIKEKINGKESNS